MEAHFEQVLVLTYAIPKQCLEPLLPPGLIVDSFNGFGFVAVAMVQTRAMRPRYMPKMVGRDFFLTGYRIFVRYRSAAGRVLRGLRILRSDTDSEFMVRWGNRLTHYGYCKASVHCSASPTELEIAIDSMDHAADLQVRAHLAQSDAPLPKNSPFPDLRTARRFAGPLPFTFDYEPETDSIIRIQGVRKEWNPKPTRVEVLRNTFLEKEPFLSAHPILASCFHLSNVPYRWKRGVHERLAR